MSTLQLLKTRRFLPYFVTQFMGAFNDSLIRRGVEILITFEGLSGKIPASTAIFSLLALFMLPFFVCSAFGGFLADTQNKEKIVKIIKMAEFAIVLIAALGLYNHQLSLCALAVFGLGLHSAFFGPVKYSLPPQHLLGSELVAGNGLIEAGTNIAILSGTIIGSLLILAPSGELFVSILACAASIAGLTASFSIPEAPPTPAVTGQNTKRLGTIALLRKLKSDPLQFKFALGISWFWTLGAVLISLFSLVTRDLLVAPEWVVSLFFGVFSVGIGAGSIYCNRLLKGQLTSSWVPLSSLAMAAALLSFYLLARGGVAGPIDGHFFLSLHGISLIASLFILASAAGVYVVPLYGMLQHGSKASERSQIIAANNILNAFLMVAGSVGLMLLFQFGGSTSTALLAVVLVNIGAAIYAVVILPEALLKSIIQVLFKILFRAKVSGLNNFTNIGPRALVIANHLSFLDAVMLAAFVPGRLSFAVNTAIAAHWWMRPVTLLFDIITLDPTSPLAVRTLISKVKENRIVVIFPEGRITVTGAFMKVYAGPGLIADKADAPLIPIRLEGFQYTIFAKSATGLPRKLLPALSMKVCEPITLHADEQMRGRVRREYLALKLHDIMTELMFRTNERGPTLVHSLLRVTNIFGAGKNAVSDPLYGQLSRSALLKRSFVLSKLLPKQLAGETNVGLLLPSGIPLLVQFFSMQWRKQVPALLNYSHSVDQMSATCKVANIRQVITSRKFIEMGKLSKHIERLAGEGVQFLYLEEIIKSIGFLQKITKGVEYFFCGKRHTGNMHDAAVILFTSGSEGTPKGVVLTHNNILSNIDQVTSLVPLRSTDKVFNALPMFHSFGLTAGTLMPLLKAIPLALYPSPLHYRIIPEVIYSEASTILFGTPTFLAGYAKKANPYDFFSVRYIFSGAERLPENVRLAYQERFGIRIFEGYGATETSPIIAVNSPFQVKAGTVGRLLPGMRYRLENIPGIEGAGRLFVSGPNIMKGYLRIEKPGILQPPADEWYDTGDIVSVDDAGFITIQGRAKRFAKIGGEMVSLTAIEQLVETEWPKGTHAVVVVPDDKKGERLILVTTEKSIDREAIFRVLRKGGLPDLAIPREFVVRPQLPLLGSGKVDVQKLTEEIKQP